MLCLPTLPSIRLFITKVCQFNVSDGRNRGIQFFKRKVELLIKTRLLVFLHLDEIYIKLKVQYKADTIIG